MLGLPLDASNLSTLWRQRRTESQESQLAFITEVRISLLGLLGQVHWRFVIPFSAFPYRALILADPTAPVSDRAAVAREILELPDCCLDPGCTRKIKAKFRPAFLDADPIVRQAQLADAVDALLRDNGLIQLLMAWASTGKVCSMHIEREFALVRNSVPSGPQFAERVAVNGFLAQVSKQHYDSGGTDQRAFTRQQGLAMNLPISANVDKPNAQPKRARGHILYMAQKVAEAKAALLPGTKLTKEEHIAIRKNAAADFRVLPAEEQVQLTQEAYILATPSSDTALGEPGPCDSDEVPVYHSSKMLGIGTQDLPLSPDIAKGLIKKETGRDQV